MNLGSDTSASVAQVLAERGVPIVLATGYGETEAIKESFPPAPVLQKPYSSDTLRSAIRSSVTG